MLNTLKNNLVILLDFDKILPPARRIGQLLGTNPSVEAGEVGMGPYFILRPFLFISFTSQAKRFNGLTTEQIFWIIEIRPLALTARMSLIGRVIPVEESGHQF